MKGIVLLGHGARNPEWAAPFVRIRDAILKRQPAACVEMGFLELMRPTLDEAIDILVNRGIRQIVIVPIFMAAGVHIKKDLPLLAAAAMERHAQLNISLAEPVGEVPEVIGAMADYALVQ
ncbi:MAG: CbiX/SirB N-terminal domain-containing protein [Betaproteobacteria bacterium]|nr:CbiX/SirB N-terminal domain-containing protein [Betaproteobacteria bacterium]